MSLNKAGSTEQNALQRAEGTRKVKAKISKRKKKKKKKRVRRRQSHEGLLTIFCLERFLFPSHTRLLLMVTHGGDLRSSRPLAFFPSNFFSLVVVHFKAESAVKRSLKKKKKRRHKTQKEHWRGKPTNQPTNNNSNINKKTPSPRRKKSAENEPNKRKVKLSSVKVLAKFTSRPK